MQILQTIGNILLFLICLSIVVCIHEAGHLAVAKICNVYCFEYSIGFGPLLFHHKFRHKPKKTKKAEELTADLVANEEKDDPNKPKYIYVEETDEKGKVHRRKVKNDGKVEGETQFSIRALPLGGYVAMAGEDGNETEDGKKIPVERTLPGVNHAKQLAIMLAGIAMNFLLAYLLFFFSYLCPQTAYIYDTNAITVVDVDNEESLAGKAGLKTGDKILYLYQVYTVLDQETNQMKVVEFPLEEDRVELTSYITLKEGVSLSSYTYDDMEKSSISYAVQDAFYNYERGYFDSLPEEYKNYKLTSSSRRSIHFTYYSVEQGKNIEAVTEESLAEETSSGSGVYHFGLFGISPLTEEFNYTFVEANQHAGNAFSQLFVGLYTALGSIFTPEGWNNIGGIISVYRLSAQGVESGSLAYFLFLWGYISLDLGCFNLLPFPGLDGWQALLAIIESIFRKKIPSKVKNVANSVGLIIMLILAVVLIVKDIVVGI